MEACFAFSFPPRDRKPPLKIKGKKKKDLFFFTLKIDAKMPDATVQRDQVEQRIGTTAGAAGPLFTTVRSVRRRVPPITPREDPGLVERSVFRMTKSAPSLLK
jgi:hypothetical protein